MYYADDILILENGLRIPPKALHPIGITNNSECWGIEIPPGPDKKEKPPHLLLSAFHPAKWHILFRVVIELQDNIGTLARAAEIIAGMNCNILSTQCAPSGHKHATWHLIVEALSKKKDMDKALSDVIKLFKPEISAFDKKNLKFRDALTEKFTIPLLKYSKEIEQTILDANEMLWAKGEKFFHDRFLKGDTLLYTEKLEQFFDTRNESGQDLWNRIKQQELHRMVESKWLQQMAIFHCYSQASQRDPSRDVNRASLKHPITFTYDSTTSLLTPKSPQDKKSYLRLISSCVINADLPLKATAAYNSEEYYLRIVRPKKIQERNGFQ